MTASSARAPESWVSPSASALQGAALCSPTVLMPLLEWLAVCARAATVATHHFFGPDAEIRYRLEVPGAWGATT